MPSTSTPNMGLIVPTVGQEPGPDWANDINGDLGILDQHNHASGQGVPITPAGLNINTDLNINSNNLTQVTTVNFDAQVASLPGTSPNLGCVYVAGNELYYNDEAGNVVPITNNGAVNAGAGSITGLPSGTASASYSSGSATFTWQSATNTPANMDGGSFVFRNILANSKGVTVSAPTALGADYGLIWPLLPANGAAVTLDISGNFGTATGTTGQVLTSNGSSPPTFQTPATNGYAQAYFAQASSWSTTSGTFNDLTNSGGNALTVRQSNGITLSAASSNVCGITFTPASSSAVYLITANYLIFNSTGARICLSQLTDGTTIIATSSGCATGDASVAVYAYPSILSGIYVPGTASPVTVKIQASNADGASTVTIVGTATSPGSVTVEWTVMRIR